MTCVRFVALSLLGLSVATGCAEPKPKPSFPHAANKVKAGAAWDDPQRCLEAVRSGGRLGRAQYRLRVATWNLRFFPDGTPDGASHTIETDVEWLACTIAWLDADLIALQEIKLTSHGQEALNELAQTVSTLTQAPWEWRADPCADPNRPHIVLLARSDRVSMSLLTVHSEIDPTAHRVDDSHTACPGLLRPALAVYAQSEIGTLNFHFITTHLDAGTNRHDLRNRQSAWLALDTILDQRLKLRDDPDIVIAADFNSVGCPDCGISSSADERALLRDTLSTLRHPLWLADSAESCTAFTRAGPISTDHVAISRSLHDAGVSGARSRGICEAARCKPTTWRAAPALQHLSDHCPVVLDILDPVAPTAPATAQPAPPSTPSP